MGRVRLLLRERASERELQPSLCRYQGSTEPWTPECHRVPSNLREGVSGGCGVIVEVLGVRGRVGRGAREQCHSFLSFLLLLLLHLPTQTKTHTPPQPTTTHANHSLSSLEAGRYYEVGLRYCTRSRVSEWWLFVRHKQESARNGDGR